MKNTNDTTQAIEWMTGKIKNNISRLHTLQHSLTMQRSITHKGNSTHSLQHEIVRL